MSSRESVADGGLGSGRPTTWDRLDGASPRHLAGGLALLAAAAPFVTRVAINARTTVGPAAATWTGLLSAFALAGPAVAAGVLAVTTTVDAERVGLAFVAAFGLLALASPAAAVPAAAAVVGGGGVAVAARWRALPGRHVDWRAVPVLGIVVGVALSLGAAMGLAPAVARPPGAHLSMLGVAATPALLGHGRRDWALGGAVAGLLVAAGVMAPFVTGAVTLISGGVVAVSLPVMAAGLAGLVTTASAGIRTRHAPAALGAGLLLVAGVPATLPRAMAAVLGVLLLVELPGGAPS